MIEGQSRDQYENAVAKGASRLLVTSEEDFDLIDRMGTWL